MSFYFPSDFRLKATGSHTLRTHIVNNLLNYILSVALNGKNFATT